MQKIILSKAWPNSRNISTQPSATLLPEKCCMRLFWFSFKSIAGGCCGIKLKKLPNLAWNFCTWACAVYSFVCCSQSYSHSLYLRLLTLNTAQYLQMKFLRFALTQILPNFICLAFSFNISEKWSCFHLRGKAVVASHTSGFQGHKKPIRAIAILTLYYEIQPEKPLLSSFCIFVRVSQFSYAPSKHLTARSRLKNVAKWV